MMNILILLLANVSLTTPHTDQRIIYTQAYLEKLKIPTCINCSQVTQEIFNQYNFFDENRLGRGVRTPRNFETRNPYNPKFYDTAKEWHSSLDISTEVCALRFTDPSKSNYEIATFDSPTTARNAGWHVTHKHHCGSCSSLQDFAVYIEKPNLTIPARNCAKKPTLGLKKKCMEQIGFTAQCSEAWAYNAAYTAKKCALTCIREYGLVQIIRGDFPNSNTNEDGNLNPCVLCDEVQSGPGFKFLAGRTRRASGIISSIKRDAKEVYKETDHHLYFTE